MKNINFFNFVKEKLKLQKESITNYDRVYSEEHGFQLNRSDLGNFIKSRIGNFFTEDMIDNMINQTNNYGFISEELGNQLISFLSDDTKNTYIKTVHSSNVESIFNEGIRCLGNASSGGLDTKPLQPTSILLKDTISSVDELLFLVNTLKGAYGHSQGLNPIDGTLLIQIPKETSYEDTFYYNDDTKTFNIKPEFIKGFIPVDKNYNVSDIITTHQDKKSL